MKKLEAKRIILSIISISLVFILLMGSNAEAYTMATSGLSNIEPTNNDFKKAKSPMYVNKTQSIYGKISSSYKMNIYHYECQEGGYYQVYTTGALDTVGAIYEEENFLFSSPSYERRAYNDIGNITGVDNCSMVIKMDKYEDYYACVRAYGNKTGSYTLNIEPNQDKTWHKKYGVWTSKYMPNSAAYTGVWTNRKIYITKEQAILYYWMLDPATTIECGSTNYTIRQLKTLYKGNPSKVVSIVSTALSSAVGATSNTLGITVSIVGLFLSESLASSKSANEIMREKLVNICGVKQKANAKTWSGKWSSTSGMLIKETYTGIIGQLYTYSYSKFNGTVLTGEKWYYGKWTY